MPEIRSVLLNHIVHGMNGAAGKTPGLTLSEQRVGTFFQLAGWLHFEQDIISLLESYGLNAISSYQQVQQSNHSSCFRVAPDRVFIRDISPVKYIPTVDEQKLTVVDLSHARTVIRLKGLDVEHVLASLTPIDFSLTSFPVKDFRQSGIHHVGVLMQRVSDDCFDVFVPSTWAVSIWQLICDSAAQFGYCVEPA